MNEYIVTMNRVTVDRGSRKNLLAIDSFALKPGELVAIVGPNGAGKSTFLQVLNLLHPYHGDMQLFGQGISYKDKTMLRRRCAMVFQDMLLLADTVFDNVALALRFRGIADREIKERVYQALADFRCHHLADRSALLLSGGEAQRVCIARALVTTPELLLLDEPFASLDAAARDEMIEEIRQVAEARGISVILVSHRFTDVLHFAERAVVLLDGRIVQDDQPENIMRRPVNEQVARLVGMDNIIPCCSEEDHEGRFIRLANGIRFLYCGDINLSIKACCIPGDALHLWDESFTRDEDQWVKLDGLVERVIPGVGTYKILVALEDHMLSVRVPRHHISEIIQKKSKVMLAFKPAEVHIV